MMTLALIILILIFIVAINYCSLILFFTSGLRKISLQDDIKLLPVNENHFNRISIIIAARNEEQNIMKCLSGIAMQDYPKDLFELIVVNDQSEDKTGEITDLFIASTPIKARQLYTTGKGGKKQALLTGILASTGDKIITTDADCEVPPCWIREMMRCFQSTGAVFITGPVMLKQTHGIFNKFQCLEFNSLIASTAGSIAQNMPVMSNGANMGFSREAYNEISIKEKRTHELDSLIVHEQSNSLKNSNYQQRDQNSVQSHALDIMNNNIASGDDVFLMLAMKHHFGKSKIAFVNTQNAIVYTNTQPTLHDFIRQRLRWVSKSSGYKDWQVIYTAISIFSFNLVLLLLTSTLLIQGFSFLLYDSFNGYILPAVTGAIYLLKILVDWLLISSYLNKFGQYILLRYLPIMEPLVVLYTVIIGLTGNFTTFRWKDRVIKRAKH